jgi:hypothetical protein
VPARSSQDLDELRVAHRPGLIVARLVCFTILTRTRRGRAKTASIRVLTTLLDPGAFPP